MSKVEKNYKNHFEMQIALLTVSYDQITRAILQTEMKARVAADLVKSHRSGMLALQEIDQYIQSLENQLAAHKSPG